MANPYSAEMSPPTEITREQTFIFTVSGRKKLSSIFKLCTPLKTQSDVTQVEYWLSETWVNLAMGKLREEKY